MLKQLEKEAEDDEEIYDKVSVHFESFLLFTESLEPTSPSTVGVWFLHTGKCYRLPAPTSLAPLVHPLWVLPSASPSPGQSYMVFHGTLDRRKGARVTF